MTEGYKVKKIYLGESQVWPSNRVNIYVDWTKLSALPDGWGREHRGHSFNNGLSVTGDSTSQMATFYYPLDMSKLNKLTLESNGTRRISGNSWIGWDLIGITNLTGYYHGNETPYACLTHQKAFYSNATYSDANGSYYTNSSRNSTQLISFTTGSNYGNWNLKMEIDFQTGKVIISSIAPYTYSYEHTLSSSILADIKTYTHTFITLYPANWSTSIVYNTSIIGE